MSTQAEPRKSPTPGPINSQVAKLSVSHIHFLLKPFIDAFEAIESPDLKELSSIVKNSSFIYPVSKFQKMPLFSNKFIPKAIPPRKITKDQTQSPNQEIKFNMADPICVHLGNMKAHFHNGRWIAGESALAK
ncbi:hypothetical protein M8J76_010651 [Diaphorina citri]|nr:hypothetical protein M8J76_010651 [Diaphorina citri]